MIIFSEKFKAVLGELLIVPSPLQGASTRILSNLNLGLILFSLGFAIGMGMLAGFIPAYQAAKLKPAEALRYE